MIYSIYGYGKGKTTASVGLAIRALANDDSVTFVQFLKDGNSSEVEILKKLGAVCMSTETDGFNYDTTTEDACWYLANYVQSYSPNLLILDEILVAYDLGYVTLQQIEEIVGNCIANNIDLCMTGRVDCKNKRKEINRLSDIVTNSYAVAHWYNKQCPKCHQEFNHYYRYCPNCGVGLKGGEEPKKGRDF